MSQCVGVRDVVCRDDIDPAIPQCRAEDVPPDAAEPVDPYFDCHPLLLVSTKFGGPARPLITRSGKPEVSERDYPFLSRKVQRGT